MKLIKYSMSIINWHCWQNINNTLHNGRANGKGIGKIWQGTMGSEGKRPRTTSVIDPPLHDSLRGELIHSWWSDRVEMALAAAGGGDRTLSDASLPFHSNCADRETSQQKHYVGATSIVMPSAHVAHAPILYWRRYREQGLRRVAGSLAVRRLRPEIKQIWHQV